MKPVNHVSSNGLSPGQRSEEKNENYQSFKTLLEGAAALLHYTMLGD